MMITILSPVPAVCANSADSYGLIALSRALCQKVKTQSYDGHIYGQNRDEDLLKTSPKKFFHVLFIPADVQILHGTLSILVFTAILPFLTLL